jgi:hypothetical protein
MLALLDDADRVIGDGDNAVHLYSFPIEAVSGIVLGSRTPMSVGERIKRLLASRSEAHIQLKQVLLDIDDQTLTMAEVT